MKNLSFLAIALFCILATTSHAQELPNRKEVLETLIRVNDYFMKQHPDCTEPSNVMKIRPSNIWTRGVYYEGLMALYQIYPKSDYYKYTLDWAEFHQWGMRKDNNTRDADDQCCGQTYIDLYKMESHPERIRNIKACMNMLVNTPQVDDWYWIDAIQMAMPIFAQLGVMFDDDRYYDKMYAMYDYSKNECGGNGLYNPEHGLWWRDAKYVPPYKEPNGKNCYWSRGNGWVYAALARVINLIPENEKHQKEYIADFKAMSKAIKDCQREDGFWNVSLHDPTNYGGKETTGTSLFVYGMAWGINHGVLDGKEYLPIVLKAWEGLVTHTVHKSGFLGWVQGSAERPEGGQPLSADKIPNFEDFGTGCFLLAGSEVYRLK